MGELAFDLFGFATVLFQSNWVALPGGVVRLTVLAVLGVLTLRGRAWARWLFFTLQVMTGCTVLFFAFVSMGSGQAELRFSPLLAVIATAELALALLVALPTRATVRP